MANSRKHLIYLVYGRQTYHQEALFSIASAFAHLRDGAAHGLTVRVYTDDPSPYAGLPVQVREVKAEELVAWCQPHGYHFRAKHVALRDALEDADQALLIDNRHLLPQFAPAPVRPHPARPHAVQCDRRALWRTP